MNNGGVPLKKAGNFLHLSTSDKVKRMLIRASSSFSGHTKGRLYRLRSL